jgi:hypothetical protein
MERPTAASLKTKRARFHQPLPLFVGHVGAEVDPALGEAPAAGQPEFRHPGNTASHRRRFCSDACRQRAYRARLSVT